MSTILEALRKSEAERLAAVSGPATTTPAPPTERRRRFAMLAVAATGLALGVLLTQVLLPLRPGEPVQQPPAAQPDSAAAAPADVSETVVDSEPVQTPTTPTAAAAAADRTGQPEAPPTIVATSPEPGVEVVEVADAAETPPPVVASTASATAIESTPPVPAQAQPTPSADQEAAPASATAPAQVAPRERLPAYQQLADLHATLGEMSLTMLVYASDPARRFALINGERLRNGEALVNGAVLTEIRRDSCVIEYAGRRFLLTSTP